jgi:hypothetical protein
MATLAQVRTRVDNWLEARWPTVQSRQEAYYAVHSKYWQGLRCMAAEPNHTTAQFNDAVSDLLNGKPTDQAETWLDFLAEISGVAIPAVFVMDTYQSPGGHGYVAHVYAAHNGTLYHRAQNVGPETGRTVAWHAVSEG